MRVTYTPEQGEKQEWQFLPGRLLSTKAELIEQNAGIDYADWRMSVIDGDLKARRVLLWHLLAQAHPTIRFEDVDFYPDDLEVEAEVPDLVWARERIAQGVLGPGRTEADRDLMLASVDRLIERAGGEQGKASTTSEADTPVPSPTSSESDPGSTTS